MDRKNKQIVIIYFSLFFIFFISIFIGSYHISSIDILRIIFEKITFSESKLPIESNILFNIRLPRIILAGLVGCALSISSACYQSLFRNPLVSEYILGVSAGAAFGSSLSIAFFSKNFPTQPMAFLGGIVAVTVTYFLAKTKGQFPVISLVLSGIITTALFTAGNYIVRYIVEPEKLQEIVLWLMGSLAAASWHDVKYVGPLILISTFVLYLFRWRLNALSMGDEEAKAMGLDVMKLKTIIRFTPSSISCVVR